MYQLLNIMFWKTDIVASFYRDFNVNKNNLMFRNCINILCCTLLKLALKYGPYHIDSFEKENINTVCFCKDIKKTLKSSMLGIENVCFKSRCQPQWLTILEKVSHVEKNKKFDNNFAKNHDIDILILKKSLLFNCYLINIFIVIYTKKCVCYLKKCV